MNKFQLHNLPILLEILTYFSISQDFFGVKCFVDFGLSNGINLTLLLLTLPNFSLILSLHQEQYDIRNFLCFTNAISIERTISHILYYEL